LVGQILSPGANLSALLLGPGKMLNSQIKKKGEGAEEEAAAETSAAPAAEASAAPVAEAAAAPAEEAPPAAPAAE
jgi:hypothetical protein